MKTQQNHHFLSRQSCVHCMFRTAVRGPPCWLQMLIRHAFRWDPEISGWRGWIQNTQEIVVEQIWKIATCLVKPQWVLLRQRQDAQLQGIWSFGILYLNIQKMIYRKSQSWNIGFLNLSEFEEWVEKACHHCGSWWFRINALLHTANIRHARGVTLPVLQALPVLDAGGMSLGSARSHQCGSDSKVVIESGVKRNILERCSRMYNILCITLYNQGVTLDDCTNLSHISPQNSRRSLSRNQLSGHSTPNAKESERRSLKMAVERWRRPSMGVPLYRWMVSVCFC